MTELNLPLNVHLLKGFFSPFLEQGSGFAGQQNDLAIFVLKGISAVVVTYKTSSFLVCLECKLLGDKSKLYAWLVSIICLMGVSS